MIKDFFSKLDRNAACKCMLCIYSAEIQFYPAGSVMKKPRFTWLGNQDNKMTQTRGNNYRRTCISAAVSASILSKGCSG